MRATLRARRFCLLPVRPLCLAGSVALLAPAFGADERRLVPPPHGFFTALPKEYGRLVRIDAGSVGVVLDRTGEALTRKLLLGADLFHHGGPATPADFSPGDRVWVVMEGNTRQGVRGDVRLLADEISVQEIHMEWYRLQEVEPASGALTFVAPPVARGKPAPMLRLAALPAARVWLGGSAAKVADLKPGGSLRFQSRWQDGAYAVSLVADAAGFERLQADQKRALERQLARDGVPASAAAGLVAGDWEVVVDRPGSAWARTLSAEDTIRLSREEAPKARPMAVMVRSLRPWGERTLVVVTPDTAAPPPPAWRPARVRLLMAPPRLGSLPPGLGRATAPEERIEWILASIYCTCGNSNDVCTGQLYTLSQCHPTACPMPNYLRRQLTTWIREGKTDVELLQLIEKEQGPQCHHMHLVK